ncbi:MAG: hypothetical protein J5I93_12970, partial [Pirellulaceae bacterium]|nr:hypothetical protein [Pirellulaceae bacterium]
MARIELPPANESLLAGPIRLACRAALRFPKLVLVAAVLLAVTSIVLAATGLEFRTSRLDLLNPSSGYNQRWLAYLSEFGQDDDAVVVVEGRDPARVAAVMDKLAERLAGEPQFFQQVWHRHDLRGLRSKGLHYLPAERLEQLDLLLSRLVPIALGQWNHLNVAERLRLARLQLLAAGDGHGLARQELVALLE